MCWFPTADCSRRCSSPSATTRWGLLRFFGITLAVGVLCIVAGALMLRRGVDNRPRPVPPGGRALRGLVLVLVGGHVLPDEVDLGRSVRAQIGWSLSLSSSAGGKQYRWPRRPDPGRSLRASRFVIQLDSRPADGGRIRHQGGRSPASTGSTSTSRSWPTGAGADRDPPLQIEEEGAGHRGGRAI